MYIDELPDWTAVNDFNLISQKSALIGFADAAYVNNGTTQQTPSVAILPLNSDAPLSGVLTEAFGAQNTPPPGLWFGLVGGVEAPATNDTSQPLTWLGPSDCMPSGDNPCTIWWSTRVGQGAYPQSFETKAINGLFGATDAADTVGPLAARSSRKQR